MSRADGIGDHETELAQEVGVISIPASSADERLPIVVEGFDPACGGSMFSERDDFVAALVESIVQAAKRNAGSILRSAQDALKADLERRARGGVQDLPQLLLDLIGPRQRTVVGEQGLEVHALLGRRLFPGTQQQPTFAAANGAKLGAGTEEDLTAELIEAGVGELDDMEWVVNDRSVLEADRVVDGVPEGLMHVHREQLNPSL